MSGGSPIIGPWPTQKPEPQIEVRDKVIVADNSDVFEPADYEYSYDDEEPKPRRWPRLLAGTALGLGTLAWVGFAGYTQYIGLNGQMPSLTNIAQFISLVSAPLAFSGVLWLLMQRSSRLSSDRIQKTINDLRAEEARLSLILDSLGTRIDSGRTQIAKQADSLMSLGEDAAHRLTKVSSSLQSEVETIGRHAGTLKTSASSARADIAVLLADLPKSLVQTRQMVAALKDAGVSAVDHSSALSSQLEILTARGREAEEIAGGAAEKLSTHLNNMQGVAESANQKIETAAGSMTTAVDEALARTADALTSARQGMEAQGSAMLAMIEQGQAAMAKTGSDATDVISARLDQVAARVDAVAKVFAEQEAASDALLDRMTKTLDSVEDRFAALLQDAPASFDSVNAVIFGLRDNANELMTSLETGGKSAQTLISQAEILLTALDASARELDETLPASHKRMVEAITASQVAAATLAPEINALDTKTAATLERIRMAETLIKEQKESLQAIVDNTESKLDASRRAALALAESIEAVDGKARTIADTTGPRLVEALVQIKDTANLAADHTKNALESIVPISAEHFAQKSREALHNAITEEVEERIASIAKSADAATMAAQKATDRLMRQMITITETTSTLEARIAEAKDDAERADNGNFARRVALIVESLNSTAIDVTKVMSNEVTDTAWAAYLRGDRGVFTRRAVKLLENSESREIVRHYENEPDFREHVNRYIHDFESMLRHVLSSRDGSALGVTMLSSDTGKLYVALAQAIDRLKT
jgi:hypothetical protein